MARADLDRLVRVAAFAWLEEQFRLHGEVLPAAILRKGFVFEDQRVPLMSMQGIFKPKILPEIPLSIRTAAHDPYHDETGGDGILRYAYRGTDPWHRDNVGLRRALETRTPLVYLFGVAEARYLPAWPVYVIQDEPPKLRFTVALDDVAQGGSLIAPAAEGAVAPVPAPDPGADARRRYITATFQRRLHQRAFRERVLEAYRSQCALCRLRHEELLDAAHIIPDGERGGEPVVVNGLSLCKLHHAAYDSHFLTVTPDYVIEVRRAILDEQDGPMLLHGLKEMHGGRIRTPHDRAKWPDRERLEVRWKRFREAV